MKPRKKHPREQGMIAEPAYIDLNGNDRTTAFKQMSEAVQTYGVIDKSVGYFQDLSNLTSNVSGRPGLDRQDYNEFRPQEAIPNKHKDIMRVTNRVYHTVGLARNMIDLMADFACQGIKINHPNKRIEKFYRNWFEKVCGSERSERFLNYLFRLGNVIIRIQTAQLSSSNKQNLYKTSSSPDIQIKGKPKNTNEIPWKYTFLDPGIVDIVGGTLAGFVGNQVFSINLPANLRRIIKNPKTTIEKELVSLLPSDVLLAARSNKPYPLDREKTDIYYYKKDDWDEWAKPMIYAILSDIIMLQKLKLADSSALDGAISNIRIIKLGDIENKIFPTSAAVNRISEALQSNVGGGTIDIVWGPDIDLLESQSSAHFFLGEEKYVPHLNSIYAGLGIPQTLTGGSGGGGATNNFISLKTLIQRLEYGRSILLDFWNKEIKKVQNVMGFRLPATITFGLSNLGDEVSMNVLLKDLADRNIISEELLIERVGGDPDLERVRTNREDKERQTNKRREKASPYHDPQFGIALKKLSLQTGIVTPSEVGLSTESPKEHLRIYEKKKGEKTSLEMRQAPSQGPVKVGQKGRPKNSKDKQKRKTPDFKPKTKATIEMWAKGAQNVIAEVINPLFLLHHNKKNFRSLSTQEFNMCEELKFGVLFNLEPLTEISEDTIIEALNKEENQEILNIYRSWNKNLSKTLNRKLTVDECRHIHTCLYSQMYGE